MKLKKLFYTLCACVLLFAACDSEDDEILPILSQENIYNIELGGSIVLDPKIDNENIVCIWKINNEIVSSESIYTFEASQLGEHIVQFEASGGGSIKCDYKINVYNIRKPSDESSPYLASLIEYKPAPGQFMNEGGYEDPEQILGKPEYSMISLGGFGGYVSATFDHTITKRIGKEILIYANAFDGSSEPGIVMVSFDFNANGIADDGWYELAGSEYSAPNTIHNYEITYTNPKEAGVDVPWTDNQGNSGVVKANEFHTSNNYYPEFIEEQESVTFTGTLLENKTDLDYSNEIYQHIVYNPARDWGYTDNYSYEYDNFKGNTFDIEWAVNSKGEKVNLPGVDFIKVYTATNVNAGWLGENSTEFMGAADMLLLE